MMMASVRGRQFGAIPLHVYSMNHCALLADSIFSSCVNRSSGVLENCPRGRRKVVVVSVAAKTINERREFKYEFA